MIKDDIVTHTQSQLLRIKDKRITLLVVILTIANESINTRILL